MRIHLPPACHDGVVSLERAIAKRRSRRSFSADALSLDDVAQLLWAGQGLSGRGFRTVPTAGGIYPVELVLVANRVAGLEPGGYFYSHFEHLLEGLSGPVSGTELCDAALSQGSLRDGAGTIVIAADVARTREVYRADAERYVHMEVGHAAQNILLQATTLGLAAVPIGAFDLERVATLIPSEGKPMLMIPVGKEPLQDP